MLSGNKHAKVVYGLSHLYVLVITAVLGGAFWIQFGLGEFPCPLCILQRMAMILAAMGAAFNLVVGIRIRHFGMSIVASVLGLLISTRQILLHIEPGDSGFGTPILGMHLYTWAWIVFLSVIVACGVHLMAGTGPRRSGYPRSTPRKIHQGRAPPLRPCDSSQRGDRLSGSRMALVPAGQPGPLSFVGRLEDAK